MTDMLKKKPLTEIFAEALGAINRPGSFCCDGNFPLVLPGLEVEGVGSVGLPLHPEQAKKLIRQCEQAPYGKGEETRVDTKIRRVWQLDPQRFKLANPEWETLVKKMVAKVSVDLGLENQKLGHQLYKLLVYEKDNFFVGHRDSEKMDRMVATLSILLPSAHKGGELVIRHDGQERIMALGDSERQYQIPYAAFYADCRHEIRPVKEGFRLALIYNLVLTGKARPVSAPEMEEDVLRIQKALSEWKARGKTGKLAMILEHQYTLEGLSFLSLKGLDKARALAVETAAQQTGFYVHLALLTLWESGTPEYGDYEDDDGYEEGPFEMEEVFESSLVVDHWVDIEDRRPKFGSIPFEREEIVGSDQLQAIEPKEEYQEYTGNEGATLERWYHHAALVLWPEEHHFDILCGAGTGSSVAGLAQMVAKLGKKNTAPESSQRKLCLNFAEEILRRWSNDRWGIDTEDLTMKSFIESLGILGELLLVKTFLGNVLPADDAPVLTRNIVALCRPHGWKEFETEFVQLFGKTVQKTFARNVKLLEDLCGEKPGGQQRLSLCRKSAAAMFEAMQPWIVNMKFDTSRQWKMDMTEILVSLFKAWLSVCPRGETEVLIKHVVGNPGVYPRTQVQVPALIKLAAWMKKKPVRSFESLKSWWEHGVHELEGVTALAPAAPRDWRQAVKLSCTCRDCQTLSVFLQDPDLKEARLRINKERRRHLHDRIDHHGLDLMHVTERSGSPQTLVCTKTRATYEKQVRQYKVDLEHLANLQKLGV